MKTLSHFNKIQIFPAICALALIGLLWLTAPAHATPACGLTTEYITPDTGIRWEQIRASAKSIEDLWKSRLDTIGASDLYVVRNTFIPFGNSGWHTHPGISLVMVISGTIAVYDGDDTTCTPQYYSAGSSFTDPSSAGHVHLLRNEDPAVDAVTVAVQLVPAGAARRIDSPDPGFCEPFTCE
ncbi:MAG TPA: hypothetical protein VGK72_00905 [Chthoniobacterales bacterium]